jgi:hypothetical protein
VKYNQYNEHNLLSWDKIRELPDPVSFGDEIVRNLDSIPISILNHALDERHHISFGPSKHEHSPTKGDLSMSVFGLSPSLEILTMEQAWYLPRIHIL